jgi:allantoicase
LFDDLRRCYVDLAQPRLGSQVVYATDDFFADKSRLISPTAPVWRDGVYDDNGKWMDGWESRRKRVRWPASRSTPRSSPAITRRLR